MMRLMIAFCLLLTIAAPLTWASEPIPNPVAEFLATRTLLVSVPFAPGSSILSASSQEILKQNLGLLRGLDTNKYLLRIEGFTSPEGGAELNVNLAMERARKVEQYLMQQTALPANWSLTGIGPDAKTPQTPDSQRRVDIVRYDNTLHFDKLPAEKLTLH